MPNYQTGLGNSKPHPNYSNSVNSQLVYAFNCAYKDLKSQIKNFRPSEEKIAMNPLNLTGTGKPTYCTREEAKVTNCALHEWFTAE